MAITFPEENRDWIKESWVGRLRNLTMYDNLHEIEELLNISGAKLRYLSDNMVLISGLFECEVTRLKKEKEGEGVWEAFSTIEKWNSELKWSRRLVWAKCYGELPVCRSSRKFTGLFLLSRDPYRDS
ncbi:hypothetical protein Fmac_002930 [Flemingia macrophylla]|uniref:Uncharacterized protein n=1 Tax=Flemingia macrophylla TaxID=520843 RepID=A0ABD1NLB6_9FABA